MRSNVPQYPVAVAAILRAGMIVVNVNPLYTPRELAHQLKDSDSAAIVILENFAHTLQEVIAQTPVKHVVPFSLPAAVGFADALKQGRHLPFERASPGPEDIAVLQYTGGTTGVSKGAVLLHRNVVA